MPYYETIATSFIDSSSIDSESIDRIYAASLLQERFINSLLRGEVPSPIFDCTSKPLQSRVVLIRPESLVTNPKTILAALGLTDLALAASLASSKRLCFRCGALVESYSSPSDLIAAIAHQWSGKTTSLYAQSPSARFSEWASAHGFSLTSTPIGTDSIHLDRLVCSTAALTPLGSSLHSIWHIPELRLECIDLQGARQSYSPTGWCATCNCSSARISKSELIAVLTQGSKLAAPARPEELLVVETHLTVRQLLESPLKQLQLLPSSPFYQAQELLNDLALDTCTFGTRTDELDAPELALVSIIAAVLASKDSQDQIIVDLPRYLLDARKTSAVTSLLERTRVKSRVSLISPADLSHISISPPKISQIKRGRGGMIRFSLPWGQSQSPIDFALCAGEMVRLTRQDPSSRTIFYDIIDQLSHSQRHIETPISVIAIPLFAKLDRSARVIGQELGLIEPLTHLYAASLDARSHGLSARDFMLFGSRSTNYACPDCCGLGVALDHHQELPRPLASPCAACRGLRCKQPLSSVLFRGVSFPTTLNQPIERSYATLASLAKTKRTLEVSAALGLHHLPLGMPVALLSSTDRRRLAIASAICKGRPTKPVIVALEAPEVDLYRDLHRSLEQVRDAALDEGRVFWLEVMYQP